MEYVALNNGTKAPLAGIGTFLMQPNEAEEAAYNALIDTANAYMNEKAVGRDQGGKGENFPEETTQAVVGATEIKSAFVQVEAHPYYPQTALKLSGI